MIRKLSKKRLAGVAFVAVLAVSGIAVAYFTGWIGLRHRIRHRRRRRPR